MTRELDHDHSFKKYGFDHNGYQRLRCTCGKMTKSAEVHPEKIRRNPKLTWQGIRVSRTQMKMIESMDGRSASKEEIAMLLYGKALEYKDDPYNSVYVNIHNLRRKGVQIYKTKKGWTLE